MSSSLQFEALFLLVVFLMLMNVAAASAENATLIPTPNANASTGISGPTPNVNANATTKTTDANTTNPAGGGGGGKSQSPIDLPATLPKSGDPTHFFGNKYYGKFRDKFFVHNNGDEYYFQFHPTEQTSEMTVKGEGWDDEYVLALGKMHWGSDSTKGSEHKIAGESFPMELQLIHYRKGDGNLEAAKDKEGGIAVLSILYQLDEGRQSKNPTLNALIQGAASVYFPGSLKQVHGPIQMKSLIPDQMAYFEYTGTLPPYNGGVKWIVFQEPQAFTISQLEKLQKLVLKSGASMVDNFRPIQSSGGGAAVKYVGPAVLEIKNVTILNSGSLFRTNIIFTTISAILFSSICLRIEM